MAFDNPIVAGTKLIRDAIESPNYVSGSVGWSINKDGSAEFNNLIVRGEFTNVGPTSTAQLIDGHFLIFTNDPANDAFTLIEPDSVQLQEADGGQALLTVDSADGDLGLFAGAAVEGTIIDGTTGFAYKSADGFVRENWQTLTSAGGWSVSGVAEYKLFPDGMVRCRGTLSPGTTAAGTIIANFPVGYRPLVAVRDLGLTSGATSWTFAVLTSGTLTKVDAGTSSVNLNGVQFPVV